MGTPPYRNWEVSKTGMSICLSKSRVSKNQPVYHHFNPLEYAAILRYPCWRNPTVSESKSHSLRLDLKWPTCFRWSASSCWLGFVGCQKKVSPRKTKLLVRHNWGFVFFQWITFVTALLWVGLLAGEIVGAFTVLGAVIGMSPTTMGLTLLAFGNTVDNVFATMGLVKNGQSPVAITGVYAADTFTMFCVCGCIMLLLCMKTAAAVPVAFTPSAMTLLIVIQVLNVGSQGSCKVVWI